MDILLVKLLDEVLQEQSHHRHIGIGLSDAYMDIPSLINSCDQADSWLDLLGLYAIVCSVRSPMPSSVITHSKPSFIQRNMILLLEIGSKEV